MRKPGSPALVAAFILSLGAYSVSTTARAADDVGADSSESASGTDARPVRAAATFFTIDAVLAKIDRQKGRGPGATRLASLTPANVATDAMPAPKEAPARGTEPFGLFTFRAPDGMLWRKWRGLEADMAKEQAVLDRCRDGAKDCPPNAAQFLRLISAVQGKSGRAQLEEANLGVNAAIRYVSDYAQFGEADRWSAPLASFATAKGDCEDYAIAKYVALQQAGFPRDDLRLVLGRDRSLGQDHAVLAARLDGRWLILDSRRPELLEDSDALGLTPLFAIDHNGVGLLAAPYVKRPLLAGEVEAVPAAAKDNDAGEWNGLNEPNDGAVELNSLPLWM
ncbi:transglutaminase-like cysteine peptidase [Bradyrhizobium sp. ISRA464]|uniref:transglutaminase-like cysteine peptidase n=1 Tax=Bradyrhizobium sp. ISRA464 TaxID=2866200 RepID=UPI0024785C45|nr:transglutaminase-like cysteine peptidase [Bradyrhizobium sp. ISRA464]WGS29775.1 transglutaminase-like cysteine peptidase [Bradyrhizobium sp. ISRA464]